MVPKIHQKGKSFKGAARYLLRDVGAETAKRVAWTEIRNVSTRNPEMAWRVMACTSIDQDRLKVQAGVPNTGRKSKDHVLHFSLSWHPEEADALNKEEMLRAAKTILQVMQAQDHQAMIICHNDAPQPHVHVLVNRVHPQDGRMLSSSFEKLKASKWAQRYEEERGKIYCAERVINNEARERGEYTRGDKDDSRHVHDVAASPANDNDRRQRLLEEHQRKAATLKQAERRQKERCAQAWAVLQQNHRLAIVQILNASRQAIARQKSQIRERFRPLWEAQHHEREAQQRVFELREAGALGRMQNALKAIDFGSLVGKKRIADDGRVRTISEAFRLLADAGARQQLLQKQQDLAKRSLEAQQRRDEVTAERQLRAEQQCLLAENRRRFQAERASLLLTDRMERAKLKAQWLEKGLRMRDEWRQIRQFEVVKEEAKELVTDQRLSRTFAAAAGTPARSGDTAKAPPPVPTKSSDLLPREGATQAAPQIDQWKELLEKRRQSHWRLGIERDDERER